MKAALSGMARSALLLEDTALIFAGCALSKAISGPVTMAAGHRAAMMRMAVHGYDQCMAGDPKSSEGVRDQIMAQVRASLGEH